MSDAPAWLPLAMDGVPSALRALGWAGWRAPGGGGVTATSIYDWAPPRVWTCPVCLATWLTTSPGPRCRFCGAFEEE